MSVHEFKAESPQNFEEKTLCCLVADTSGSMAGEPIETLNDAIEKFIQDVRVSDDLSERLELGIIQFDDVIKEVQKPALAKDIQFGRLITGGSTRMVDGARAAIEMVKARKIYYRQTGIPYKRPWVILLTDGCPNSDQDVAGLKKEVHSAFENKDFVFLSIGIGDASMPTLQQIAHPSLAPLEIKTKNGIPDFTSFFKWLSASMSAVSQARTGQQVNLPAPTWGQGVTV